MAVSDAKVRGGESCLVLDMRGRGLSDKPAKGYDMPQVIQDLEISLT